MPEISELRRQRRAWTLVLLAALAMPSVLAGFASAADGSVGYILGSGLIHQLDNLTLAYETMDAATISGEITIDGVVIASYRRSVSAGNQTFTVHTDIPADLPGGMRTLRATFYDGLTVAEDSRTVYSLQATHTPIISPLGAISLPALEGDPRLPLAIAAIGLTALGAIVVDRRWPFLLTPLYARIAPHRALEHPVRRKLLDMVTAEPGITIGDAQRRLALSNGVIAHHVHTLERTRHIVSMEDGQLRRLYPIGVRGTTQGALSERIVAALSPSAPIRAADLARDLGVSRQALHYHIAALERAGTIRVEKRGRDTFLYPSDAPTAPGPGEARA